MKRDIHNIAERAKLIGFICTQYSYFDYLISNVIWHVLGIKKEIGIIVTGSLDIRPKIEMAISLLNQTDSYKQIQSTLQKIKNNASKSSGFISKRNLIIHGIYSTRDGDPVVLVEAHRKKSHHIRQEISIDYIKECLEAITKANNHLTPLLEKNRINVH